MSRPNSEGALYRLDAATALLAKAVMFVKQAREDLDEVRGTNEHLLICHELTALLIDELNALKAMKPRPLGLRLKSETPEENRIDDPGRASPR